MLKGRVLIVDDEPAIAESLSQLLAARGYETAAEGDGISGLHRIERFHPSVVIADVLMPRLDGFGLLRKLREQHPEIAVILLTGRGSVEMAVRALQEEGAYHYFEKPFDIEKLSDVVERAVEYGAVRRGNEVLRRQLRDRGAFGELVGTSEPMKQIYSLIEQVAPSSASVLITGESGTGKELVARTIHNLSPRRNAPFVAINCSAIPDTLMESELFGHEKGAFTGAASRRQGCFELATTGTLLLDEIAEMPTMLQAKLLRVLEERVVRRLGGAQEIPIDVRVLAATNRDPHEAVTRGVFREDLLYRLNVITLELPPLRRRKEDLQLLAQHLVMQLAERHGRPARLMSNAALEALKSHHWPGNVRELRNIIERAVIICSGEIVERHHLAPYPLDQRAQARSEDTITLPVGTPIEEVERQMILRTLQKTDNNKTHAAELLQISLKTLHNKLRQYRERVLQPDSARAPGEGSHVQRFNTWE
ncbi:MAG TPA: sigma-54 dependent transcriptional regulator [Pyrinomonadaceae bacterium]|jgi:DNA-binding NtrC family response regulator|nr:sigma-54 dependent transcriptional regulator [Pyrinomonadaceae bacterium]